MELERKQGGAIEEGEKGKGAANGVGRYESGEQGDSARN